MLRDIETVVELIRGGELVEAAERTMAKKLWRAGKLLDYASSCKALRRFTMLGCVEKISAIRSSVVTSLLRTSSTSLWSVMGALAWAMAIASASAWSGSAMKRVLRELKPLASRRILFILPVEYCILARASESLRGPSSMVVALWRSA